MPEWPPMRLRWTTQPEWCAAGGMGALKLSCFNSRLETVKKLLPLPLMLRVQWRGMVCRTVGCYNGCYEWCDDAVRQPKLL